MNRIFVLIFSALLSLGVSINANGKERVVPYNYELSVVQEGNSATSGHKIFKVWSFGKKSDLTEKICMRKEYEPFVNLIFIIISVPLKSGH